MVVRLNAVPKKQLKNLTNILLLILNLNHFHMNLLDLIHHMNLIHMNLNLNLTMTTTVMVIGMRKEEDAIVLLRIKENKIICKSGFNKRFRLCCIRYLYWVVCVIFTTVHRCQLLMMWRFLLSFNLFHSCLRNLLLSCLARRTLRAWLLITQSSSSSSSSSESPLNTDLYCTVLYCTMLRPAARSSSLIVELHPGVDPGGGHHHALQHGTHSGGCIT